MSTMSAATACPPIQDIWSRLRKLVEGAVYMATVLTSVGEGVIIDYITGDASAPANYYVGWGTGAGTAAKGDTDLFTPATEARVAATESQPLADKARWVATITAGGAKTITNAGLFDAAGSGSPPSGGNLIIKGDFTGIALASGDKIEFTIEFEQT